MKSVGPILALALLTAAKGAHARCDASGQLSTCVDVDTLWPHAGGGRFTFVGGSTTARAGELGVGLVTTYLARPLVLQIPSTIAGGTEVAAVDRLWDRTLLWSAGITKSVELSLALPFTTYRSGSGVSALAAQRAADLSRTAVRDIRIGSAFELARGRTASGWGHAIASRLELALPTGEPSTFSGDRFAVLVPSFAAELSYLRFVFAAELGARIRGRSEIAGSRLATQIVAAVGVAAKLLDDENLSLQLEAITLPTLVAQHDLTHVSGVAQRAVAGSRPLLAPTEWQISLRTAPILGGDASATLGAGGSLPLTGEYGVTSPAYRVVLALRYAPAAPAPHSDSGVR